MARPFNRTFRSRTVLGSPALAAETAVCQITNIATDGPSQVAVLTGFVAITIGTAGTALRLRIRQSAIGGTVVADTGAVTGGIAAGNVVALEVQDFDLPGDVDGFTYILTAQVTAASAGSAVSSANLIAIVSD
jgi:hypothetical protein